MRTIPIISTCNLNNVLENGWQTNGQLPFIANIGGVAFMNVILRYGNRGAGVTLFTIPQGFRPSAALLATIHMPIYGTAAPALAIINTNGKVNILDGSISADTNIQIISSWVIGG